MMDDIISEIAYEEGKDALHNFLMWIRAKYHYSKAKRKKSVHELLIAFSYEDEQEEWVYSRDKSEVICKVDVGTIQVTSGNPIALTLLEAFIVPLEYRHFIQDFFSHKDEWPEGVEYFYENLNEYIVSIKVYASIDFRDSPRDDLRDYLYYLSDLRTDFHKKYNLFRSSNSPVQPQHNYNINGF